MLTERAARRREFALEPTWNPRGRAMVWRLLDLARELAAALNELQAVLLVKKDCLLLAEGTVEKSDLVAQ